MALRLMTPQLHVGLVADLGTPQDKVTISNATIAGPVAGGTSGEMGWALEDMSGLFCVDCGP